MITVYGYGFSQPKPPEPQGPGVGTYAIAALAAWWAWTKWGKSSRVSNPRRSRRLVRRRHNPKMRRIPGFRMGDTVRVGRKKGVIVAQPTSGFHRYDVKLSDGRIKDYAVSAVRPV
jgi:hypothetical protein